MSHLSYKIIFILTLFNTHIYFTQFKLNKQKYYKQSFCISNKITIDT